MSDEETSQDQHEESTEETPIEFEVTADNDEGQVTKEDVESEKIGEDEECEATKEDQVEAQDDNSDKQFDEGEGRRKMEEAQQSRMDRQMQELEEYEEIRKVEREKEMDQIQHLREKKEARKTKVVEESDRLKELGAQEEMRRKHEDDERKRKKLEAEREKQEDKERKRREAEERLKPKKPNYVITKRPDGDKNPNVAAGPVPFGREDMQKSKEQLEEEKHAILSQRIQPLSLNGLDKKTLFEKAKELYEHLRKLEGDNYDLEENMKRQQYDMMELQERARQMNKGGKRNQSAVQVNETFDRLADKFTGAPPRIQLCSKYERHTDHRTYVERRELYTKEDQEEDEESGHEHGELGQTEVAPAAEG